MMKPCLCCGVTQSGYEEGNDHYVAMVERLLYSATNSRDQKSLLFVVEEITKRLPTGISTSSYSEKFGWVEDGTLCGDHDYQLALLNLLDKATSYLLNIEKSKSDGNTE